MFQNNPSLVLKVRFILWRSKQNSSQKKEENGRKARSGDERGDVRRGQELAAALPLLREPVPRARRGCDV